MRRWYTDVAQGRETTAVVYVDCLRRYVRHRGVDISDLLKEDAGAATNALQDYIQVHYKHLAPKTKLLIKSAVQSFLAFNDLKLTRDIRIGNTFSTPTLKNEKVPTQEQLERILDHSDTRTKAIIACIAWMGLRFRTMAGIRLEDFRDGFKFEEGNPVIASWARLDVQGEYSKNKRPYFVFVIPRAATCLADFLVQRVDKGETLRPESLLITATHKDVLGQPISTPYMAGAIKAAFKGAGFRGRPYVLRSYFDSALQAAKLQAQWQHFFMGHTGDIEMTYTLRKQLTAEKAAEGLEEFKQALPHLDPREKPKPLTSVEEKLELARFQLDKMGVNLDEIIEKKAAELDQKAISVSQQLVIAEGELRKRMMPRMPIGGAAPTPFEARIVGEVELVPLVVEGWDVVKELSGGRVIVRRSA